MHCATATCKYSPSGCQGKHTKTQRDTSASIGTYPVELLLELLICIIYTELLKTVPSEGLKPAPREILVSSACRHFEDFNDTLKTFLFFNPT